MFSHISVTHARQSFSLWNKKFTLEADRNCFVFALAPTLFAKEQAERIITEAIRTTNNILLARSSHLSSLLEKINAGFLEATLQEELSQVQVFLALTSESSIDYSTRGNIWVYLVKDGSISDLSEIHDQTTEHSLFSSVTSGGLQNNDFLLISTESIFSTLNTEDITDLSKLPLKERHTVLEPLISRSEEPLSLLCLALDETTADIRDVAMQQQTNRGQEILVRVIKKGVERAQEEVQQLLQKASQTPAYNSAARQFHSFTDKHERPVRIGLFLMGIGLSILLLYIIINALFSVQIASNQPTESREKLIQAQLLLERTKQDIANKEVFAKNIRTAENLIFEVREKRIYLNDVKNLLETVSILKKQLHGIDTYDINAKQALITLPQGFEPIHLFKIDGKISIVGVKGLIPSLAVGAPMQTLPYPEGEEAISADIGSDNSLYILTKNSLVLRYNKGDFTGVNVENQKTWEQAKKLSTFNGNLYLLSADGTEIFRHKPGLSGFGAKTAMTPKIDFDPNPIIDFSIDGSFYLLKKDLTVEKVFTAPSYQRRSLVLNNLPENYQYEGGELSLQTSPNALHIYLLLDGKIWIFEPDNRNFKDVKALKYLGQIEFSGDTIRAFTVIKNGELLVTGKKGVHQIVYDVHEGKVVLRIR